MPNPEPIPDLPPTKADTQAEAEERIRELARLADTSSSSHEGKLDDADVMYSTMHDAGLMRQADGEEEHFEFPSITRERRYQQELRKGRPPEIARGTEDPLIALRNFQGPAAILEVINDNDPVQGSTTITWLGPETREVAEDYLKRVGTEHAKPGPGEEDGVYTCRDLVENPYFQARE